MLVGEWDALKATKRLRESKNSPHCQEAVTKRQCIPEQPSRTNEALREEAACRPPRTLVVEYWGRTDECLERKWTHLDLVDRLFDSREELILATTLSSEETVLEPNLFPYDTPEGVEHWTLWSRRELDDAEIEKYVLGWLRENAPDVESWNYDENLSRSIDVFHVHVYLLRSKEQRNFTSRKSNGTSSK